MGEITLRRLETVPCIVSIYPIISHFVVKWEEPITFANKTIRYDTFRKMYLFQCTWLIVFYFSFRKQFVVSLTLTPSYMSYGKYHSELFARFCQYLWTAYTTLYMHCMLFPVMHEMLLGFPLIFDVLLSFAFEFFSWK